MSTSLAYLNGQFVSQASACLPIHDAGFVMGATVTDLCRTIRHKLYRWEDHLNRFQESCAAAQIDLKPSSAELTRIAQELVGHNAAFLDPARDLGLVLFVTAGSIGIYAGLPGGVGDAPPTLGMHTFPLPHARFQSIFCAGAQLAVSRVRQVGKATVDPRIKHRSRLHWWLADQDVKQRFPGSTAILLDEDGCLTETAAANLLVVKEGTVLSPPRDRILNGVSLQVVEELCAKLALPFAERDLQVQDALGADEMMLCNTSYCLGGVIRFDAHTIPWPGPIFRRLLAAWSAEVSLDLAAQAM